MMKPDKFIEVQPMPKPATVFDQKVALHTLCSTQELDALPEACAGALGHNLRATGRSGHQSVESAGDGLQLQRLPVRPGQRAAVGDRANLPAEAGAPQAGAPGPGSQFPRA